MLINAINTWVNSSLLIAVTESSLPSVHQWPEAFYTHTGVDYTRDIKYELHTRNVARSHKTMALFSICPCIPDWEIKSHQIACMN